MTQILLTRPLDQAREFSAALVQAGWAQNDIIISPIIEIQDAGADQSGLGAGPVIITSSNALRFLTFDPSGRVAYCVGQATTTLAQAAGFDAQNLGGSAADLLENLLRRTPGVVTHLSGEHVSGDIVETLSAKGWDARQMTIYLQSPQPLSAQAMMMLTGGTGVVLPLFSSRSARLVGEVYQGWHNHVAVAISENVADICANIGFTQVHVAKRPDAKSVLDTICKFK